MKIKNTRTVRLLLSANSGGICLKMPLWGIALYFLFHGQSLSQPGLSREADDETPLVFSVGFWLCCCDTSVRGSPDSPKAARPNAFPSRAGAKCLAARPASRRVPLCDRNRPDHSPGPCAGQRRARQSSGYVAHRRAGEPARTHAADDAVAGWRESLEHPGRRRGAHRRRPRLWPAPGRHLGGDPRFLRVVCAG